MSDQGKFLVVILIFAIWGYFVYLGLTPASDYIQALRDAIIGLGVFSATLTIPKK